MKFFRNLFAKPIEIPLMITSSHGFHLRPVAQFVTMAKSFDAQIDASFKAQRVDAKKIHTLLGLSLDKGDSFVIHAKGKDAKEALIALKALFISLMKNEKEIPKEAQSTHSYEGKIIQAESISQGIAIAPLAFYQKTQSMTDSDYNFEEALALTLKDLSQNSNAIQEAQKALLLSMAEECQDLQSFEAYIVKTCESLQNTKNESKIADYQDIAQGVKSYLGFKNTVTFPKEDFILFAHDLLPSELELLSQTRVQAVILQNTSIYSHTAILLRSFGIASLIVDAFEPKENEEILLDAYAGLIIINPSQKDKEKAQIQKETQQIQKAKITAKRFDTALTTRGKHIHIYANVSDVKSAQIAKEQGAEGIGLLRSEFLFTQQKPSIEAQRKCYKEIFDMFEDVTVRTLDVGGDKALPYIQIPHEDNPFLGIRGIRLFHSHGEILKEQLYAIFLASHNKKIKIMFPMVSNVEEFLHAKNIAQELAKEKDLDISNVAFGIMIEVPSVLFLLEAFNQVVDFYSIGSNDLSQYLFATERTHPTLKINALSPVLFASIAHIMKYAQKPVSICGELASNEKAIAKLIDLGIERLSVSPKSVARCKERVRSI